MMNLLIWLRKKTYRLLKVCLLYTSDAADERSSVDLGGRGIIKKTNRRTLRWQTCTYYKKLQENAMTHNITKESDKSTQNESVG